MGLTDGGWRRFDLIYLVLDKAEEATDRKLARHLLSLHYERGQNAAQVSAAVHFSIALTLLLRARLHLLEQDLLHTSQPPFGGLVLTLIWLPAGAHPH